jgi:hypothetical protein
VKKSKKLGQIIYCNGYLDAKNRCTIWRKITSTFKCPNCKTEYAEKKTRKKTKGTKWRRRWIIRWQTKKMFVTYVKKPLAAYRCSLSYFIGNGFIEGKFCCVNCRDDFIRALKLLLSWDIEMKNQIKLKKGYKPSSLEIKIAYDLETHFCLTEMNCICCFQAHNNFHHVVSMWNWISNSIQERQASFRLPWLAYTK